MGRLVGRFYDAQGQPTALLQKAEAAFASVQAERDAQADAASAGQLAAAGKGKRAPPAEAPCNVRWSKSEGASGVRCAAARLLWLLPASSAVRPATSTLERLEALSAASAGMPPALPRPSLKPVPAGGWVSCPEGSFPRRVQRPDWQGTVQEQCACLAGAEVDAARLPYEGCSPGAVECQTSAPEAAAA